jgi:hypothetical protein
VQKDTGIIRIVDINNQSSIINTDTVLCLFQCGTGPAFGEEFPLKPPQAYHRPYP